KFTGALPGEFEPCVRAVMAAPPIEEGFFDEADREDAGRLLTACCMALLRDDDRRRLARFAGFAPPCRHRGRRREAWSLKKRGLAGERFFSVSQSDNDHCENSELC